MNQRSRNILYVITFLICYSQVSGVSDFFSSDPPAFLILSSISTSASILVLSRVIAKFFPIFVYPAQSTSDFILSSISTSACILILNCFVASRVRVSPCNIKSFEFLISPSNRISRTSEQSAYFFASFFIEGLILVNIPALGGLLHQEMKPYAYSLLRSLQRGRRELRMA